MLQYIDWMLFSDDKILVNNRNVKSILNNDKSLIYQTPDEYNKLDMINNIFIRKTDELYMEINFKEKFCMFDFGIDGKCKFDIVCDWKSSNDEIILQYTIDDSMKKLHVILKEIVL